MMIPNNSQAFNAAPMQTIDQSATSFKQRKSSLEVTITKIASFTVEENENSNQAEVKEVDSEDRISPALQ